MRAAGKKKKTAATRPGGFDRAKLNSNFMANSKSAKDNVQGWAFDFDNPDAGMGGEGGANTADDDAVM